MEGKEDLNDVGNNGVVSELDYPNPLKKLIEGFCSPQNIAKAPTLDHDDGDDDTNDQYAPDLTPQKATANQSQDLTPEKLSAKHIEDAKEGSVQEATTDDSSNSDPVTTLIADNPATVTTETVTHSSSAGDVDEQESIPDNDVSKKVIANRRKRGVENFIMACIFVLTTLFILKKLGFKTSDFNFTAGGRGNGSSSWIHVVDKSLIEDQVKTLSIVSIDETLVEETVINQVDNDARDSSIDAVEDEL